METRFGSISISLTMLAAMAVAAGCSPLAPSVSKLTNAAASKTTPTDGLAPGANLNKSGSALVQDNDQNTRVVDQDTYNAEVAAAVANNTRHFHFMDVDSASVTALRDDLRLSKSVKFQTSEASLVGRENIFAKSSKINRKVYLIINTTPDKIDNVNSIRASLKWIAAADANSTGRWELTVSAPSMQTGDFTDVQAQRTREALRTYLTGIVIVMDHEKKQQTNDAAE